MPAGTGITICAVLEDPGSAPERISSSDAAPTRLKMLALPSRRASSAIRFTCRPVSSMAVPSGSFSAATTIPSSTWGRISLGSRTATAAVAAVKTMASANTVLGRARHHSMPFS